MVAARPFCSNVLRVGAFNRCLGRHLALGTAMTRVISLPRHMSVVSVVAEEEYRLLLHLRGVVDITLHGAQAGADILAG